MIVDFSKCVNMKINEVNNTIVDDVQWRQNSKETDNNKILLCDRNLLAEYGISIFNILKGCGI